MPYFNYGESDTVDKLNALYTAFAAGPYNAMPKTGGTFTGAVTFAAPNAPLIINSTNGTNIKVLTQDNGVGRGYWGSAAGFPFQVTNAANSAYAMTVSDAGTVTVVSMVLSTALAVTYGGTGATSVAGAKAAFALDNVDNTSDVNKPVSTAAAAAINSAVTTGVATRTGDAGGFGFRNRIINGGAWVAQRASAAFATGIAGYGGPDRFFCVNSGTAGGSFTQSQSSITFNGLTQTGVRQTVGTAIASQTGTNSWFGVYQIVEGFNCYDLKNKPIVVSFIFNATLAGAYSVALRDGSGRSFLASFNLAVANTPQRVVVKIPVLPAAGAIPNTVAAGLSLTIGALNQGTYRTAAASTWQTGTFLSTTGAVNWGATTGNFIEVTELQLEAGTFNTEFETRPFAIEQTMCFRYYETGVCRAAAYTSTGNSYVGGFYLFKGAKRSSPTLTYTDAAGTASRFSYNGVNGVTVNAGGVNASTFGVSIDAVLNATINNTWWLINYIADNEL